MTSANKDGSRGHAHARTRVAGFSTALLTATAFSPLPFVRFPSLPPVAPAPAFLPLLLLLLAGKSRGVFLAGVRLGPARPGGATSAPEEGRLRARRGGRRPGSTWRGGGLGRRAVIPAVAALLLETRGALWTSRARFGSDQPAPAFLAPRPSGSAGLCSVLQCCTATRPVSRSLASAGIPGRKVACGGARVSPGSGFLPGAGVARSLA